MLLLNVILCYDIHNINIFILHIIYVQLTKISTFTWCIIASVFYILHKTHVIICVSLIFPFKSDVVDSPVTEKNMHN